MPEPMSEATLALAEKLLNDPKLREEDEGAWPYGVFRQAVAEVRRLKPFEEEAKKHRERIAKANRGEYPPCASRY